MLNHITRLACVLRVLDGRLFKKSLRLRLLCGALLKARLCIGCHRSDWRDLQPDKPARILGHLRVVLPALVFIHHVVMAGPVFIKSLGVALLDILNLTATAFYPVPQHGATHQTNHGCQSTSATVANSVADSSTRHSAQQCTPA